MPEQRQRREEESHSGFKGALQGLGIFLLAQFVIGQFFNNKQNASPSSQPGGIPAFEDRPDPSQVTEYSAIPDLITPIWPSDSSIDISVYVAPSIVVPSFKSKDSILVMQEKNFTLGNYSDTREIDTIIKVPKQVQQNGTLFAHFFLARTGHQLDPAAKDYNTAEAYHFLRPLNQYLAKKKAKKLKNLLANPEEAEGEEEDDTPNVSTASYYHPNFTLSMIPDSGSQRFSQMHPAVRQYVQLERTGARDLSGKNGWYYPIAFLNTFWQLKTHMTELNSTVETVPLRITLNNLANWKFSIISSIDEGSKQSARQAAYGNPVPGGGDGTEWEMVKEILLDTNVYLLSTTAVVTVLHMIFETLAFKNDISHWRKKKDVVGTSVRTILANVFMQSVIFLYLMDNSDNTSWMILASQGFGILLEAWKITKTVDVRLRPPPANSFYSFLPYVIVFEDKHKLSETEKQTKEYDEIAFRYLYIVAVPLLLAYAGYSLMYNTHKSWYSYIIQTLVGSVYAYGFLMMVPSLYINYRLKSVAHMPGKAMAYKFLNTFIDDLFAFTVKMPWLHRLATLRDDVIFFIWLYQSYKYKVDFKRVNEFGQGGDSDEEGEEVPAVADSEKKKKEEEEETVASQTSANVSSKSTRTNQPSGLLDAIEHLEAVAFIPVKQRYTDAGQLVKTIASDAYENGIPQVVLGRLLKILTVKNHLDQGSVTTLVKNLYPQERIASKYVTQVVCCLGPSKSKPSPATQALLVRWLILAYHLLEDGSHIGKLYAVLFNHLDMISLRKQLCHLLSLTTRRKHVKPFRIQALMEIIQNAGGEEKEAMSLLKIFKNYYPEIVLGDVGSSRRMALFFKHPDPEWSSHANLLQSQNMERAHMAHKSNFQVISRGGVKRSRVEVVIPVLQTSRVSDKHTSLEEIRDMEHFVDKLDKIELPNQIISTLGNATAQKYLHLVQSESANHRLDEWLRGFLEDRLEQIREDNDEEPDTLSYVLSFIEQYASFTKDLLPSVRAFLESYLKVWNGSNNRHQILRLLQYLPIEPYGSLRETFFSFLESTILDGTVESRTALLEFYSTLISEWSIKLRAKTPTSELGECVPLTEIIQHAELLASTLQVFIPPQDDSDKKSKPIVLSILRFYKYLSGVLSHASQNAAIRLTVPLAPTVYTIAFTPSVSAISALNSILADYKSSFEASLTSEIVKPPNPSEPLYPTALVSQFNGYVMDMCNLVWRNRALNTEDPNAQGCVIPSSSIIAFTNYVRDVNEAARHYDRESAFHVILPSAFSLSHNVAFANLSAACFAELEENQNIPDHRPRLRKPVTQKALQALEKDGGAKTTWQEYRVHMLDWLDTVGSRGTGDLMRSTMKALRKE
ncbi:hypothetical protein N7462_010399 [Penicillium macrosclerotiorum]|uniref:uncharacterized protein n=1 Tax=Penicillium macrosclerotiorum TaxID=303699 RepID=UPI002548C4CA|nr:uncharacterized protein N7462_010399 [Penicillium macrosclerotiorum]KAJ5669329.1 hypothetical protein N7462_010399 [Penicillium macrosclerotiorum]